MKNFCLLILLVAVAACTHKPFAVAITPVVVKVVVCDTLNVTYNKDIQPIFSANCYSCHATSVTAGGGLDLESFTSLSAYMQYGFRGDGTFGSKFYHCVSHSLLSLPMPPDYKLDSCELGKIRRWISLGAPNS